MKRKAPRLSRQGTRSSARLRGQNSTVVHGPTPIEPETKQAKRKRGSLEDDNAAELPKKRAKRSDDQTAAPMQEDSVTLSDSPPVDLGSNENADVDHLGQPVDDEGSGVADPPEGEPAKPRGFFLLGNMPILFAMGGSGRG